MFFINRKALAAIGLAAVATTTFLLSTPASAASKTGSASVDGGTVYFQAGAGKTNSLTITISGRTVTLDDKVTIKAGKGCKPVKGDSTKVRCTTPKKTTIVNANLGDKNDKVVNKTPVELMAFGGSGNDTLWGGSGRDVLSGESGVDYLYGQGGNDGLYGDAGNDWVFAGSGNDTLTGGTGDDWLEGEAGNDKIWGEAGNDNLQGGTGNDTLHGDAGNDNVVGGAGNDRLYGEDGKDRLFGNNGNDYLSGALGNDLLVGGWGTDQALGGDGDDTLVGEETGVPPQLSPGVGNDVLSGGTGRDILIGGGGSDTLNGGANDDVLYSEYFGSHDYKPLGSTRAADKLEGSTSNSGDMCVVLSGATAAGCEKIWTGTAPALPSWATTRLNDVTKL